MCVCVSECVSAINDSITILYKLEIMNFIKVLKQVIQKKKLKKNTCFESNLNQN